MPLGFAGGMQDKDTGLLRFGVRDYDPQTGRWTARDPLGFAAGDVDLYGYVANDPVNFVDPFGLQTASVTGSMCPAAAAAAILNPELVLGVAIALGIGMAINQLQDYDIYWRYSNGTNSPTGPWLTGKGQLFPPYGWNYDLAQDKLQLPQKPTKVNPVFVPKSEPVVGPRTVSGNPDLGSGGGQEWYRNSKFPPVVIKR